MRLFKSMYGKTPHQYLTDVRINRAMELLIDGETVKRAAYAVGFDSVSSFTGLFLRRVGQTPGAFQRNMQARKVEIAARPLKFIPNCFIEKRGWAK